MSLKRKLIVVFALCISLFNRMLRRKLVHTTSKTYESLQKKFIIPLVRAKSQLCETESYRRWNGFPRFSLQNGNKKNCEKIGKMVELIPCLQFHIFFFFIETKSQLRIKWLLTIAVEESYWNGTKCTNKTTATVTIFQQKMKMKKKKNFLATGSNGWLNQMISIHIHMYMYATMPRRWLL